VLGFAAHSQPVAAHEVDAMAKQRIGNRTASKAAVAAEGRRQQKTRRPGSRSILNVQNVCAGSPIPAGWITTNDHWDPTSCGKPTQIVYNVLTITRYDNQPVGAVMNVCAGAPTPNGWVVTNSFWDPTSCGHPTQIVSNISQIKRIV